MWIFYDKKCHAVNTIFKNVAYSEPIRHNSPNPEIPDVSMKILLHVWIVVFFAKLYSTLFGKCFSYLNFKSFQHEIASFLS